MKRLYLLLCIVCLAFTNNANSQIKRVRLNFMGPESNVRPLLLGFVSDEFASDGVDYGYDGAAPSTMPDDLLWLIEGQHYVVQGVGDYNDNKTYPFGMYLENSGKVKIELADLENFEEDINVYIHDSVTDIYYPINDKEFELELENGDYENRFYIAFSNLVAPEQLSISEQNFKENKVYYNSSSNILTVSASQNDIIKSLACYSVSGRLLFRNEGINSSEFTLELKSREALAILQIVSNSGTEIKKVLLR